MAGDDVDDVDPDLVGLAEETGQQQLGCCRHPSEAMPIERMIGRLDGRASLDLHEGQNLALASHQIDLADRGAHPLPEDGPTLAAQVPGRERLGSPAAPLGLCAGFGQRPSSSARS